MVLSQFATEVRFSCQPQSGAPEIPAFPTSAVLDRSKDFRSTE
jgi:hypothetical protein